MIHKWSVCIWLKLITKECVECSIDMSSILSRGQWSFIEFTDWYEIFDHVLSQKEYKFITVVYPKTVLIDFREFYIPTVAEKRQF